MRVLEVGGNVILLRFLPDGRRVLAATASPEKKVTFGIWPVAGGEPVRPTLPELDLDSWWYRALYGNAVAINPDGAVCYLAWDRRLYAFRTADGARVQRPADVRAYQVCLSPRGDRLLAVYRARERQKLVGVTFVPPRGVLSWSRPLAEPFRHLAGFLPDGDRYVTIGDHVQIHLFATGDVLSAVRYPTYNASQPQISPDGRYLGIIGYSSMYFYDLTALDKPRRIGGTRSCGDFEGFAFHPNGKTVAVIHGGPTLVKVYDLATLKRVQTWKWKLGPLGCVAFSSDGTLGAAGSRDGRVVVWDVDE
jgi:WD40 repeat protein